MGRSLMKHKITPTNNEEMKALVLSTVICAAMAHANVCNGCSAGVSYLFLSIGSNTEVVIRAIIFPLALAPLGSG